MTKPGFVYLHGKSGGHRPFMNHREIRRGQNKGKIEVQIRKASKTGLKTVKRLVTKDEIIRYPGE